MMQTKVSADDLEKARSEGGGGLGDGLLFSPLGPASLYPCIHIVHIFRRFVSAAIHPLSGPPFKLIKRTGATVRCPPLKEKEMRDNDVSNLLHNV